MEAASLSESTRLHAASEDARKRRQNVKKLNANAYCERGRSLRIGGRKS
jgi:hypothetical protein